MTFERKLLNEQGGPGHRGPRLPKLDVPARSLSELLPDTGLRDRLELPQVSEPEVVRHFVELSTLNHHLDKGFYPLGSCTMKHNPKINDEVAGLPGFALAHPLAGDAASQGALRVTYELQRILAEVTGFAETLEDVIIKAVEDGHMTKDLALLVGPDQGWETTEGFLATLDERLAARLA